MKSRPFIMSENLYKGHKGKKKSFLRRQRRVRLAFPRDRHFATSRRRNNGARPDLHRPHGDPSRTTHVPSQRILSAGVYGCGEFQ
jgi:hypothetical protein